LLAAPGDYTLALDVDGHESHATLKITADPRVALDGSAVRDASALYAEVAAALDRNFVAYGELQSVDKQIAAVEKQLKTGSDKVAAAKKDEERKLESADKALRGALDKFKAATKPLRSGDAETSTNLGAIGELLSGIATDIEGSDRAPTQPQRDALAECSERTTRASALWERIKRDEFAQLGAQLKARGLSPIAIPAADQIRLTGEAESQERP